MGRILSIVREMRGIKCLPCEQVNLDAPYPEEYQDAYEHPAQEPFERPRLSSATKILSEMPPGIPSVLRLFLDGSRKTYKVADVVVDNRRYLPIVAGQIGVAVVQRSDAGYLEPLRDLCGISNVIAFPDSIAREDLAELENRINSGGGPKFKLLSYKDKANENKDPVDLGVAKVMSEMHDMEIRAVQQMEARHILSDDYRLLVIDGPLRFRKRFDLVQFRNVLGVSKSFRPSFTVGKGRRKIEVGSLASSLRFSRRTSAFRMVEGDKTIGMWYLRIRPREKMANPLQGVIKVERYAIETEDKELGLETDRVDTVSRHLVRERNVTPFGRDPRWASHLYPVYLAESYLKASFLSDVRFRALF